MLQLLHYLLYLDLIGTGACTMRTNHCFAMKSGCNLKPYNRVCNKPEVQDTEIEDIKQFFGTIPFTWVVDVQDATTITKLQEHGFQRVAEFPAMIADISKITAPMHEPKLIISEVQHPNEATSWIQHTAAIYNYDFTEFNHAISYLGAADNKGAVKLYRGRYNNEVICTGMVIYHDALITVHTIGTVPEYRNKGFGYDFTYQLLSKAAHNGSTQAILLATPSGESVYKKLGFVSYATYYFYTVAG